MKKIVFVDVVSLTFFLESWMLQQGADSSMVDGKFYFILYRYLTKYLHDHDLVQHLYSLIIF